ncbi:MAG TPA: hypothetical protein VH989_06070 [Actinomycetota bacterium]
MAGVPSRLREFVKLHRQVEAIVQHVGLATWDLFAIDVAGNWTREEFSSKEDAEAACAWLGIRAHDGWDEPRLVRRLNGRDHWSTPDGQRRAL